MIERSAKPIRVGLQDDLPGRLGSDANLRSVRNGQRDAVIILVREWIVHRSAVGLKVPIINRLSMALQCDSGFIHLLSYLTMWRAILATDLAFKAARTRAANDVPF